MAQNRKVTNPRPMKIWTQLSAIDSLRRWYFAAQARLKSERALREAVGVAEVKSPLDQTARLGLVSAKQ